MDKVAFYRRVRSKLGALSQSQVDGFERILDVTEGSPLAYRAYMLATPWHETAATMQPVREAFKMSEAWRKKNLRYWPHYGRGDVQLTWLGNYELADKKLAEAGLIQPGELVANPDLAMRPDISAFVLLNGMTEGWFTGKKLSDYLPKKGVATRAQYIQARRIINILDKADLVEDYAQIFERALRDAGQTA